MDSGFDFESNENAFPNSIEDGDVLDDQFKADGLIDGDLGQGSLALDGDNDNEEDAEDELPGVDDLPLFAGPEARKIHLMIKDNEVQIEETDDKIVDLKDRIKVMKEHFKNVQQELEHTNSLQGAKLNEIRTEKHLKQLTSRALGGHKIEAKRIKTELERVQDALNDVQNQIFASNQKMDEFKLQMNWNQEELEQWSLAAKQKEEDFLALEKYKRADDFKVKELELKQEHLTKNLHLKRTSLDNEIAETDARQAELDRVSKDFDE
jgi:chromosome segregation ATPase